MDNELELSRVGYMCKTDFTWELGAALDGNTVYPSVEDLKKNRKCWEECGIVKVKILLEEVVTKSKRW